MSESLNKQAEIDINKLVSETGHVITAADLPALFELNKKAQKISDLSEELNQVILSMPIDVHGKWLMHPTISRLMWVEHHSSWYNSTAMYLTACAFACSVDVSQDDLDGLLDADKARNAIVTFGRKLKCNILELALHIKSLLLLPEDGGKAESGSCNYWNLVSFLCREYGATPDYWRREADIGTIAELLNDHNERAKRESKMLEKQGLKGGKTSVPEEKLKAVKEYRDAFNDLKKAWNVKE
jgi:hypothetical protein